MDERSNKTQKVGDVIATLNLSEMSRTIKDSPDIQYDSNSNKVNALVRILNSFPKRFRKYIEVQVPEIQKCFDIIKAGNIVTFTGEQGSGKTAAACALAYQFFNYWLNNDNRISDHAFEYIEETELMSDFYKAYRTGGAYSYRDRLVSCGLLLIDDFLCTDHSETMVREYYHIINRRYAEMKPTIITTNLSNEAIEEYSPRIISRMVEGFIKKIDKDDRRLSGENKPNDN